MSTTIQGEGERGVTAGAPRCHGCRKAEGAANLVWCDAPGCDFYICRECSSQTLWELEACSDECGEKIAARLMKNARAPRSEVHHAATRKVRTAA